MAVKFLMPHSVGALYAKGEIAGFEPSVEKDLVDREIAEPVRSKPAEKPAA